MLVMVMAKANLINTIPKEVALLENEEMLLSSSIFSFLKNRPSKNYNPNCFLYHGIRFDESLKKLENIFKTQKILAGKYISNQYMYSDNANKGEYVSLLAFKDNGLEYDIFIESNISLLISPLIEAYLSKYVSYDTWEKIKDIETKNLYSYMNGEYLCKDYIPFEKVQAIGVPYHYFLLIKGKDYANQKLDEVKKLMNKHNINLPILDTSHYNEILVETMEKNNGKRNIK